MGPTPTRPAPAGFKPGEEIVEKRTATSKSFTGSAPGEIETSVYPEPIHFRQTGRWLTIDPSLQAPKDGKLKNKANRFGLELAESADDPLLAKVQIDSEHSIAFSFDNAAKVKGKADKDSVTYSGVMNNTDVRLTSKMTGVKEELILSSAAAPDRFVFPLILKGLTASIDANSDVIYKDSAGTERGRTPHGYMFDSNVDPRSGEPAMSTGVTYKLITQGNGTALEITLDRLWLDSPDRIWPITVDPDIYNGTWSDDTYVMSPYVNNYSSQTELKVGTFNGGGNKARAFMHFDVGNLPGPVFAAQLQMRELHSYYCPYDPEPVHRVTQGWAGSTLTSYPGATIDPWETAGTWAPGSGSCSGAGGNRLATWNVTGDVQGWQNGGITSGAFAATARSETDSYRWKKYRSYQAGDGPLLKITTNYAPVTWNIIPAAGARPSTANVVLSGNYADGDGTPGYIGFGVYNTSGQLVFDAWSPLVNSNGVGSVTTSALADGLYRVNAIAWDGVRAGPWTPDQWFTVDTRPPGTPTELTPVTNSTVGSPFTASARYTEPTGRPGQILFIIYNEAQTELLTYAWSQTVTSGSVGSAQFNLAAANYKITAWGYDGAYSAAAAGPNALTVAGAPGAPTGLTATAGPSSALIKWTPPSDGGFPITRYDFTATDTANSTSIQKSCTISCSPTNGFVFDGLTAGRTYTFKMTAINAIGASAQSQASPAITIFSSGDYANNLSASAGDKTVTLQWAAQPLATSYRLKTYLGTRPTDGIPNDSHFVSMTEVGAVTTNIFTGLKNGSKYYFTVTPVVLLLLVGSPSAASNEVIPFGVPFAPVGVSALPGNGKSTVLWNPPPVQSDGTPGDNGSAVTGYRVLVHAGQNEDPIRILDLGSSSTLATVEGLENGISYSFRVGARNAAGDGPLALSPNIGSPGGVPFQPENAIAVSASSGSAAVSWEPPSVRSDGTPGDNGSPIDGYRVLVSPDCPECTGANVAASTHSTMIGGLPPGQEFVFTVLASNMFGESLPSNPTSPIAFSPSPSAAPSVPTNVVAEWIGEDKASVSWGPSDANGSPVTGYTAVASPGGLEVSSMGSSAEFIGLDPTQAYTFRVRAHNSVGQSALSAPSAPIFLAASSPAPPTNVIGSTPRGRGTVQLEWEPSDPGASPATAYIVQIYESSNDVESGEEPSAEFGFVHRGSMNVGMATRATVPVPIGKKYYFLITAKNAAGETNSLPTLKFAPLSASDAMGWTFLSSLNGFIEVRSGGPREDDPQAPFPKFPYSFESDGCSVEEVRERLGDAFGDLADEYSVYFEPACQRHDFAYQNLGRRYHLKQEPGIRTSIDRQFEQDMTEICADTRPDDGLCKTAANTFWFFVRRFAEDGFESNELWTHRLNEEAGMAPCDYTESLQCTG